MAEQQQCDDSPHVDRVGGLDVEDDHSPIEAPRKPRSAKQVEAFKRCREALLKKCGAKPEPQDQSPEPKAESPEPQPEAPEPTGVKKRGPYKKGPRAYQCHACEQHFESRFDLTNHRRRGKCPA